jgi:acylphosphatase
LSDAREPRSAERFYVSGTVQGVGYRFFARRTAEGLRIAGFAKNLPDGRVEVYAVGTTEALQKLREELHRGPEGSRVTGVEGAPTEIEARFANFFSIER